MAYTYKHGDRPLDDFTIQRGVGRGGFGEVYYAISDGGREVALKYLRDNPGVELRGVSHCMNLKSPHLVTVFDVKKNAEGEYFIVMEYVTGPSLRDLLVAEPEGLGPQKAAYFIRELAKGLSYLHDRGIVHRDLKPGNIFYEDGYVKIGDYGLSKFISVSRHSAQTASVGTVHYMAPEIGSGSYSRGVDIYALGVMLYEMLLGKVPFEGASLGEVLMKHLTEQPEVDELPHPYAHVIRKALAKDPQDRYQTVEEMIEELFGVDDIKESLVGFNPTSLSGVVRQAGGHMADSPIPSPNPPQAPDFGPAPPPPHAIPMTPAAQPPRPPAPDLLGTRIAKRMDRVSRKLDKKLKKMGGRPLPRATAPPATPPPAMPAAAAESPPPPVAPVSGVDRWKRLVLCLLMTVGLSIGIGLLVSASVTSDEVALVGGVTAFLMSVAVTGGVMLSAWLAWSRRLGQGVRWLPRVALVGCCLPLVFVSAAPLIAELDRYRDADQALAVFGAVMITLSLAHWDQRLLRGAKGDISVGLAIKLAALAGALALAFNAEEVAMVAAGVMAAASLNVQALGWAWPLAGPRRSAPGKPDSTPEAVPPAPDASPTPAGEPPPAVAEPGSGSPAMDIPLGIPMAQHTSGVPRASHQPLLRLRSSFSRSFWSVIAFLLAGGTIVLFIVPLVVDDLNTYRVMRHNVRWYSPDTLVKYSNSLVPDSKRPYRRAIDSSYYAGPIRLRHLPSTAKQVLVVDSSNYMGYITGCVACFSFLIFALRKTTQRKRPGFWLETARPFMIAAAMTGMGASITAMSIPGFLTHEDDFIGTVVGLVFSSLLFLVLLILARGRRPKPQFLAAVPAAVTGPAEPDAGPGDQAADDGECGPLGNCEGC